MFKFMKSKKGFTLVELMIVVVIMAILVAVAVPIYSAVTANAKKKTCIGNQREIVASIGNAVMLSGQAITTAQTIKITTTDNADNGEWDVTGWTLTADGVTADDIKDLFKTTPFCPGAADNVIEITVTTEADGSKANVVTKCSVADHVLPVND